MKSAKRGGPGRRRGEGRVAFLALLEEVRIAVKAGWPQVSVYEKHREKLGMSKRQFDRYVLRYVTGTKGLSTSRLGTNSQLGAPKGGVGPCADARLPTFQFDPDAKDLKKLIG